MGGVRINEERSRLRSARTTRCRRAPWASRRPARSDTHHRPVSADHRHRRDRRLPERREVDARQPPDRHAGPPSCTRRRASTRDRKELICEWRNRRFLLIDTGGVDIADATPITRSIADQAREAVAQADIVLFVLDAQIGITPGDEEVAQILRESKKPVLVIANKIDDPKQESLALELHKFGLGDPIPISGLHGHGTGDLLDEIVDYLDAHGGQERPELPRGRDPRRDPRPPERRQVESREQAARPRAARSSPRSPARPAIRSTRCSTRRPHVRARRHRRPAPQAPPPPGHRLLLGAPRTRGGGARRHRARAHRRGAGRRRPGSRRRRHRAQGRLRDADRPLEVGHQRGEDRGGARPAAAPPAAAAGVHRRLGEVRPRPRPAARRDRRALRPLRRARCRRPS